MSDSTIAAGTAGTPPDPSEAPGQTQWVSYTLFVIHSSNRSLHPLKGFLLFEKATRFLGKRTPNVKN
jgi:hypothetical protein